MTDLLPDDGRRYGGMTVNERLFSAGLIEQYDDAARRRDRELMIQLLRRVEVQTPEWSVDVILADPERYGYGPDRR